MAMNIEHKITELLLTVMGLVMWLASLVALYPIVSTYVGNWTGSGAVGSGLATIITVFFGLVGTFVAIKMLIGLMSSKKY